MSATGQRTDDWSVNHVPAANTQATIGKAAVGDKRHRCTGITATCYGVAAVAGVLVNLRDGATGAGTILWTGYLASAANLGAQLIVTGLNIVGSVNTAMTLEFAAASGATTFQAVTLTGWTGAD